MGRGRDKRRKSAHKKDLAEQQAAIRKAKEEAGKPCKDESPSRPPSES